jgi:hypothetical protein
MVAGDCLVVVEAHPTADYKPLPHSRIRTKLGHEPLRNPTAEGERSREEKRAEFEVLFFNFWKILQKIQ